MNKTDALLIADKILALINSQPRTPSREEIAVHWNWRVKIGRDDIGGQ